LVHFFTHIYPLLHEKNQDFCRRRFRDQPTRTHARTDTRTDGGDFIDPFGFQPGTKKCVLEHRRKLPPGA